MDVVFKLEAMSLSERDVLSLKRWVDVVLKSNLVWRRASAGWGKA